MKVILYSLWVSNKIFLGVHLKNIYFFCNLGHNAGTTGVFMENEKPTKNAKLVEKFGAKVAGFAFIIELTDLNGIKEINDYKAVSLVQY